MTPELGRQHRLSRCYCLRMNPIEAAILAGELTAVMDRLSTLDLHPVDNAADIETMRRHALSLTEQLSSYLHVSENFLPVEESADAVQEWDL